MRICIDIDGTICHLRHPNQQYQDLQPIEGSVEKIQQLKDQGAYIILCTARHMKTCDSNIGKVMAREGGTLLWWLKKYNFVYDELWLGKPYADVYIDDKALHFKNNWDTIDYPLLKTYI